jgi:CDP-diacylglycerol--glycerol-3-phosphate 3-phosphatidyltransferase
MSLSFTKKEIFTISNGLSFFRLLLAIPFWFVLENLDVGRSSLYALGLCVLAYLTDISDGFLARKLDEVTEFGKVIDPFADKIVVGVIILKLFLLNKIPAYYFIMVAARDILIFAGGIFITRKIGRVLPSNILGKITVVFIGAFILFTFVNCSKENFFYLFFYFGSIVLIFASLIAYFVRGMEFIKRKNGAV